MNWKVGDKALCIRGGPIGKPACIEGLSYPEAGKVYTVASTLYSETFLDDNTRRNVLFLELEAGPLNYTEWMGIDEDDIIFEYEPWGIIWGASRFIKFDPDFVDDEIKEEMLV